MTTKPRRRWFRFSLRTFFVLVTIFCVWLGWNVNIVRERKAIIAEIKRVDEDTFDRSYIGLKSDAEFSKNKHEYARLSLVRRLLGDESCINLSLPRSINRQWVDRAEIAFPEADLWMAWREKNGDTHYEYRAALYKPAADRGRNWGTLFKTGLPESVPDRPRIAVDARQKASGDEN